MTWVQPASASISGLISPVNAPFAAPWQSCPPRAMPLPAIRPPTVVSMVAGGPTRSWQPGPSLPAETIRWARACASAELSSRNPFIFQLPATSFVRTAMLRPHGSVSIFCLQHHIGMRAGQPARAVTMRPPASMLQAIRSRAGSLVVKALFGLLILTFGVWGIGDIFRNRSTDTVIVTVGDQKIHGEELQAAVRRELDRLREQFGAAIDLQQAKKLGIVDTILEALIDRSVADQEAARLRLDVSDEVIRDPVTDNPRLPSPDGSFDRALFNAVLAQNRLNEDQFVAMMRRDIPRNDLLQALKAGAAA